MCSATYLHEVKRCSEIARPGNELFFGDGGQFGDGVANCAHMAHRLNDIAAARFALAANHRRAFRDPAQRFTQILGAVNKRHVIGVLIEVVLIIRRREHFGLVDIIDAQGFKLPGFAHVADAYFSHHRES